MISQNCNEIDRHIHYHANHTTTPTSQISGIGSCINSSSRRILNNNHICGARCRSLLSYQQHQLQIVSSTNVISVSCCSDTGSSGERYSPHPNEMFLKHHGKLSTQQRSGYDDTTKCCLPPPSPAPISDRYIIGVTSPQNDKICDALSNVSRLDIHTAYSNYDGGDNSTVNGSVHPLQGNVQQQQQHHQHINLSAPPPSSSTLTLPQVSGNFVPNLTQKYVSSMQQCSISANSRFRLSDGHREVPSPKSMTLKSSPSTGNHNVFATVPAAALSQPQPSNTTRYVSSAHFLTENTPMVTSDTYTYLSSTVHTPVKRYVPTPPPQNELYADISMQASTHVSQLQMNKCANSTGAASGGNRHGPTQHLNMLPYRFHMKCCSNYLTNSPVIQTTDTNTMTSCVIEHRPISVVEYYATSPRTQSTYGNNNHVHNIHSRALKNVCTSYDNSNIMTNDMGSTKSTAIILLHDQQMQTASHATTMSKLHAISSCQAAKTSTPCSSALSGASGGSTIISTRSSTASSLAVGGSNCSNMYVVSGGRLAGSGVGRTINSNVISDYFHRAPSIEYINASTTAMPNSVRICATPVNQFEVIGDGGNGGNLSSGESAATTCLHCNTVRRTTGVHQTTQTTGPISPLPIQQVMEVGGASGVALSSCGSFLQSALDQAPLTPSTSKSHISPLLPSTAAQNTRILFPSKVEGVASNAVIVDQLQLQQPGEKLYVTQKTQQHSKNVITQGTITEHMDVFGSGCNQQQLQQTPDNNRQLVQYSSPQLQQQSPAQQLTIQKQQKIQIFSRKKRFSRYIRKEIARFFGVHVSTEAEEFAIWQSRQRRLALRRFGALKPDVQLQVELNNGNSGDINNRVNCHGGPGNVGTNQHYHHPPSERPDILPAQDTEEDDSSIEYLARQRHFLYVVGDHVERKASVARMIMSSLTFIVHTLSSRQPRSYRQWSRSFAPAHVNHINNMENSGDISEGLSALQEDEVFFDSAGTDHTPSSSINNTGNIAAGGISQHSNALRSGIGVGRGPIVPSNIGLKMVEHHRQIYVGERIHGWRTSAVIGGVINGTHVSASEQVAATALLQTNNNSNGGGQQTSNSCGASSSYQHKKAALTNHIVAPTSSLSNVQLSHGTRGKRISAQLLDGVLENSRRPLQRKIKNLSINDLDDRSDHRPFFTYWINTVQILVLLLSLFCYGIGPIGIGVEQKTGQVLVTSLSLQTVQHSEQRNVWIGPRNNDLVHMGAKFATCMRSDIRIMDVMLKTRRQERESACCIRNDDSGCVQSSQAECSVRGLFPTKSISTWKKWSPGESGPGGRISGSVCGLDPKYCDAPASIAPYEWPDDITKWPICRKTNSFSHRFRYKDHTAEHMVCEVIGHPCCTGVYGECRITTREYCDFVKGYFHEEASLCSQISCLNNVCGMLPFISVEVPDQFYRLFTSLCLHAGIIHLAITIAFQHFFLADLERLIGPLRTAIVYIGSGLAGNLISAVLVPYKPEVGPLASLSGVIASLVVLLILIHWKHLRKPHLALFKLTCIAALLFGIGTLPWQLNFAGLLAGIFCGVFLTIAFVPFVSITKYGRKAKLLPKEPLQTQGEQDHDMAFYHYTYNINRSNNQINGKFKNNRSSNRSTSFANYYYQDSIKNYTNRNSSKPHNNVDDNKKEDIGTEADGSSNSNNRTLNSYSINNSLTAKNTNVARESGNGTNNDVADVRARAAKWSAALHLSNKKFNQINFGIQASNLSFARVSGESRRNRSRSSSFESQQLIQQQQHPEILHSYCKYGGSNVKVTDTSSHSTNEHTKFSEILSSINGNGNFENSGGEMDEDREMLYKVEEGMEKKGFSQRPPINFPTTKPLENISGKRIKNYSSNTYISDLYTSSAYKIDYVVNKVFLAPIKLATIQIPARKSYINFIKDPANSTVTNKIKINSDKNKPEITPLMDETSALMGVTQQQKQQIRVTSAVHATNKHHENQ
ncbi:inactive rhomboid protein 1 isoform X2 [Ceratitis capitata]|uniref:inactive rhomboid protein 1 isoform X2 n=1 Tax=Ceratitis capitata TaxID=7213 RepID=UPI00032A1069|nr:inactive rhomboid protein 1 isoform X2 [Ceratitis capitata]